MIEIKRILPNYSPSLEYDVNKSLSQALLKRTWIEKNFEILRSLK